MNAAWFTKLTDLSQAAPPRCSPTDLACGAHARALQTALRGLEACKTTPRFFGTRCNGNGAVPCQSLNGSHEQHQKEGP